MLKKKLSMLMAAVLIITALTAPAVKAEETNSSRAGKVIEALGIMKTDDGSKTNSKKQVTRAQFSQMMVKMSSYKDMVSQETNVSLFKDVSKKHWAAGYIKVAISEQWLSGYLNGKFMPNQGITLQEAVNAVLKLLGYENSDFSGNKNAAKMSLYYSKDMDKHISKKKNQKLTRTDCMNLFYNTLTAKNKAGVVYGTTMGYTLDASGEIDYLGLIGTEMKGPVIAGDNWEKALPLTAQTAVYYRNSIPVSKNAIQKYDVLYYSKNLNTVWAYSEKILGTVDKIAPDQLNPTEVTIAGNVLKIGTQEMSYQFSTLGKYKEGDVITALLGKDGSVVGALTEEEYAPVISGVVIKTGKKLSEKDSTKADLQNYVVMVDTYGHEYTFDYGTKEVNFPIGGVVDAAFKDGEFKIDHSYQRYLDPIGGKVNQEGTQMGQYPLAKDIKILEVQKKKHAEVYLSRITETQVSPSDILYYSFNSNGEVDEMILNNFTGDLSSYGILLEFMDTSMDTNTSYTFKYMLDGKETSGNSTSSDIKSQTQNGPAGFSFHEDQVDTITSLKGYYVKEINGRKLNSDWNRLILSDQAAVYYVKDSKYYETKLSNVSDLDKYNLTAYYDKDLLQGGRVRVVIAQDK